MSHASRSCSAGADKHRIAHLIETHVGLAKALGRRWARRSADEADVTQVALLGLVRAARAYDPSRGTAFSTFAFATITGDIRRYYRDATWAVHVPRRLQEDYLAVAAAREHLTHELGRSPTIAELTERTGLSDERVIEAIEVRSAYDVVSFDAPPRPSSPRWAPGEYDAGYDAVDRSEHVLGLIRRLPVREQEVVRMRFFEDRSQSEIALELGVSQMQVSRLLRRSLDRLRILAGTPHLPSTHPADPTRPTHPPHPAHRTHNGLPAHYAPAGPLADGATH